MLDLSLTQNNFDIKENSKESGHWFKNAAHTLYQSATIFSATWIPSHAVASLYNGCFGYCGTPLLAPLNALNDSLLASNTAQFLFKATAYPTVGLRVFLNLFPFKVKNSGINYTDEFNVGLSEELFFRKILQGNILPAIQRKIIRVIVPGQEHLVDHTISKIVRNVIVSTLFTISHLPLCSNRPESLIPIFIGSLALGYAQENGASLTTLAIAHMFCNLADTHLGIDGV